MPNLTSDEFESQCATPEIVLQYIKNASMLNLDFSEKAIVTQQPAILEALLSHPAWDKAAYFEYHYQSDCNMACRVNSLPALKILFKHNSNLKFADVNVVLTWACASNAVDIVDYLLTSPDLPHYHIPYPEAYGADPLASVCSFRDNDFTLLKYLLTSPRLLQPRVDGTVAGHADIHCDNEQALRSAAQSGDVEVVRYLLSSNEFTDHAILKDEQEGCLYEAAICGNLEVVKYLLTSSEVPHYTTYLKEACIAACYKPRTKVLDYLLHAPELSCEIKTNARLGAIIGHAKNGRLELMQQLLPADYDTLQAALVESCINKHIDVIEYLVFNENVIPDLNFLQQLDAGDIVTKIVEKKRFNEKLHHTLEKKSAPLAARKL